MSLFGSFTTAISGLTSQSRALGHVSDNIANSQTVGFKRVDTNFVSYLTQSDNTIAFAGLGDGPAGLHQRAAGHDRAVGVAAGDGDRRPGLLQRRRVGRHGGERPAALRRAAVLLPRRRFQPERGRLPRERLRLLPPGLAGGRRGQPGPHHPGADPPRPAGVQPGPHRARGARRQPARGRRCGDGAGQHPGAALRLARAAAHGEPHLHPERGRQLDARRAGAGRRRRRGPRHGGPALRRRRDPRRAGRHHRRLHRRRPAPSRPARAARARRRASPSPRISARGRRR